MTGEPFVLDVALAQLTALDVPTVIVPVARDGEHGVFYASYDGGGDAEWLALARAAHNQAELAIACCQVAYADALARYGAHASTPGGRR